MFVLSFGVSFIPLYLALFYHVFCLGNGFQVFFKRFSKQRCFQSVFLKNRDYVISYVACSVFLAYDRFRNL